MRYTWWRAIRTTMLSLHPGLIRLAVVFSEFHGLFLLDLVI